MLAREDNGISLEIRGVNILPRYGTATVSTYLVGGDTTNNQLPIYS